MTPSRVSPGSATSTVAHKKWSGAITAAAAPLLLVLALTGRADATCTVYVHNDYSYGLTIDAYNGWDGICGIPVLSFDVNGLGGFNYADCYDATECKVKIQGDNSCDGTVSVPCGDELKFFYDADGTETFSIGTKTDDNTRRYLEAYEVEAERDAFLAPLIAVRGGAVADAADVASSSSLEEGVEDVTSISSSSLRGAKGSKRSL